MEKKIYALRNGMKPGIYNDWLSFYEQIRDLFEVDYRIFYYDLDLVNAPKDVENSMKWALAQAKDFINELLDDDCSEFVDAGDNPFDEFYAARREKKMALRKIVLETNKISTYLKKMVVGQDSAIELLEKAYFHNEKDTSSRRKGPKNVFLFAGPPGVGKTYTAELFAETIKLPYKRFDMSAYASWQSEQGLVGFERTYRDSAPGIMTKYVKENPKCVLLFDEIEKAYIAVIRLFLQILDDGTCIDKYYDENVSFKDCIIFFTTNAGKQLYQGATNENLSLLSTKVIVDALEKDIDVQRKVPFFPPELVSRLSSHTIIMFNHLKSSDIRKVVQSDINRLVRATKRDNGYFITGTEALATTAQYSTGGSKDARNASKIAGKVLDEAVYDLLMLIEEKNGLNERNFPNEISLSCDFTNVGDEICQFYFGEKNGTIAVFGDLSYLYEEAVEYDDDDDDDDDDVPPQIFKDNNISVKITIDPDEYRKIMQSENVIFSVIDFNLGRVRNDRPLSILDAKSKGHDMFFETIENNKEIPIYVLNDQTQYTFTPSEIIAIKNAGAADFIDADNFNDEIETVYRDVCCDRAVDLLQSRHQVMAFDTRKEYDDEKKSAQIIFYNLRLENAVDAEDKDTLLSDDLRPDKHWDDIFVSDDVKKELTFFIDYLSNPKAYANKGVSVPKGALMYGPPGTGKTSLAKVVATESGINFLAVSGDELSGKGDYVVHELFRKARKYAPAVLFIDEIDAVGLRRDIRVGDSALNALLTEMDGFSGNNDKPVFVMAATNLEKEIDPALLRRFDRNFCVDLPQKEGREWILRRLIAKNQKLFEISEKEIESIVIRSAGASPALLEKVVELALRDAVRSGRKADDAVLDEAFEKLNYGDIKEVDSNRDVMITAYHEAGHAIIQLANGSVPEYMSVVARGDFGGYVLPEKMGSHPTKEDLLRRICISLGGRASEMEFGYGITPGASSDLSKASDLARRMVCEYGMYEEEAGLFVISREELAHRPDAVRLINRILSEQLANARRIVRKNRNAVVTLVETVMNNEKKYLTRKDMEEVWEKSV